MTSLTAEKPPYENKICTSKVLQIDYKDYFLLESPRVSVNQ